jgi:hypothetical protein
LEASKNRTIKVDGTKQKSETSGGSKTTLARCDLGTRSGRKRNEQEGAPAPVLKKNDAIGKTDPTTAQSKANIFFIEIQQDYTKSIEVTTIPPSFNWKSKLVLGSLLHYKSKNETGKW